MAKIVFVLSVLAVGFSSASAQTTPLASWPVCQLGKAPIDPEPAPKEATVFPSQGGPVVMSEAGQGTSVRWLRCRLSVGTPSYRGADGVLRDVASNQPYFPVGWDVIQPKATVADSKVRDGRDGRGIARTQIVRDSLIVTYTDSTTANLGRVVGRDGKDGVTAGVTNPPPTDPNPRRTPRRINGYDDGGEGFPFWRTTGLLAVVGGTACAIWCPRHHDAPAATTKPPGSQTGGAFLRIPVGFLGR